MFTPAFNPASIQPVSPKLAIDFTTASLDSRITFTRTGNTATVTNSSGNVVGINADLPRFDYNPITLACNGLLIEEQRQNIMTYSDQFNNAVYTKVNSSVTADAVTSPDGTTNADLLLPNTTNGQHRIDFTSTATAATHSFSVYAKGGGYNFIWIRIGTSGGVASLTDGTTSSVTAGYTLTATLVANGWYRVVLVGTAAANTIVRINALSTNNTNDYAGNGTSGIYIWGAQLEAGSFPTSYIPTVAAAVTRNADVAVMTGTNFSDWYNSTQGTFRVDATTPASGTRPIISADDNTAANSIVISTVTAAPTLVVTQNSSEQANVSAGTITANTAMFAYVSYASNYFGIARPTARQVDTSGTVPTVDRLRLGANQAGSYLNGPLRFLRFWS